MTKTEAIRAKKIPTFNRLFVALLLSSAAMPFASAETYTLADAVEAAL
ncbi:hypothetical protein [Ponticaulis sp.]|nr:hypothetical protein [Ponticaulis sp.]